jgi:hypothetical protein
LKTPMCDAGSWIWCRQLVLRTEIDDIPIIPAAGLNVGSDTCDTIAIMPA